MKKIHLVLASWCSLCALMSQNLGLYPSPQASSLITYATVPVNHSTGVPNISIPIYELTAKNHSLPISLSYHTENNKVYDVPSWVGLGWSLNAGGVISRVVRGLPDEETWGYSGTNATGRYVKALYNYVNSQVAIPNYPEMPSLNGATSRAKFFAISDLFNRGTIDQEPDLYYYNFQGNVGSFIINESKQIINQNYSNLTIAFDPNDATKNTFLITTVDGTRYYFGSNATTREISYTSFTKAGEANSFTNTSVGFAAATNTAKTYISSYYLGTIAYTDGEFMNFSYQSYTSNFTYSIPYHTLSTWNYSAGGRLDCSYTGNIAQGTYQLTGCTMPLNIGKPEIVGSLTVDAKIKIGLLPNIILFNGATYLVYYSGLVHDANANVVASPPFNVNMYKPTTGYQYPYGNDPKSVYEITLTKAEIDKYVPKKFNMVYVIQNPIKLAQITSSRGYVKFEFGGLVYPREDPFKGEGWLDVIRVYDNGGNMIKSFDLSYSYFINAGNPEQKRLKLMSVQEFGANNLALPPVLVKYNEVVNLPAYGSCAVDPLGYYNGVESTTFLNRASHNPQYSMANLISSIWWPSGLKTQFEFESGGLGHRIKSFASVDIFTNKIVDTENYTYLDPNTGLSSAKSNYCGGYYSNDRTSSIYNFSTYGEPSISISGIRFKAEFAKPDLFGAKVNYEYVTVDKGLLGKKLMRFTTNESNPNTAIATGLISPDALVDLNRVYLSGGGAATYATIFQNLAPSAIGANCNDNYIDNSYQQGRLLSEVEYDVNNNPRRKKELKWIEFSAVDNSWYGIKPMPFSQISIQNGATPSFNSAQFQLGFKQYRSANYFLQEEKITQYEQASNSTTTWLEKVDVNTYDYHSSNLLIKSIRAYNQNKNEAKITYNLYPADFNVFNSLYKDRIIEKVTVLERNNALSSATPNTVVAKAAGKYVLSGEINSYNLNGTVASTYVLTAPSPILSTSFVFSNGSTLSNATGNGAFNIGSNYLKTMDYEYRRSSNNGLTFDIARTQKPYSYRTSLLWGYGTPDLYKYPIAKVVNADYSGQVVAHTSFENPNEGGWTYGAATTTDAKTGTKCIGGTITNIGITSPNASLTQSYKLSFWAKGGGTITITPLSQTAITQTVSATNAWVYYEFNISTTNVTINTGTVLLDELRMHPTDAFMETYTYKDLVGKTSETDMQNKTTYYEYDEFGRLLVLRDQDKNILKKYTYSYDDKLNFR